MCASMHVRNLEVDYGSRLKRNAMHVYGTFQGEVDRIQYPKSMVKSTSKPKNWFLKLLTNLRFEN